MAVRQSSGVRGPRRVETLVMCVPMQFIALLRVKAGQNDNEN